MSKKRKKRNQPHKEKSAADKKIMYGNLIRLLVLIAVTMMVYGLYRFLLDRYYFEIVLIIYMSISAIATFAYVIYNRGFSRKGVTPDMLPDTMTKQEKQEFIEDGERRLKRSRPLLIVVFAFAFTFVLDIIELFAIPLLKGMLGK